MSLFQRITDLVRANLGELVSRAEDPEKVLTQAVEDMQRQLGEAKKRVALALADEKRLEKQVEAERARVAEWEQKAMTAIRGGRDDLAMQALAKRKEAEAAATQLGAQRDEQHRAVDELKQALVALAAKIDEAQRERALLMARIKRAEAQKTIAETLSMANDRSAFETFARMAEKVDRIEAEAGARLEVAALVGGSADDRLKKEIDQLGTLSADIELLALKSKMGLLGAGGGPQAQLPASTGAGEAPPVSAPSAAEPSSGSDGVGEG